MRMTIGTRSLLGGRLHSRWLLLSVLLGVCATLALKEASAAAEKLTDGKYQLVLGAGSGHSSCTSLYTEGRSEEFEVVNGRVKQGRRPFVRIRMRNIEIYRDSFTANFLGPAGVQGPHSVRMEGRRVGNEFKGKYIAGTGGDNCRGQFKLTRTSPGSLVASDGSQGNDAQANGTNATVGELYAAGTGFFVSSSGHVVTNKHVVSKCDAVQVQPVGRPQVAARIVATDKFNDLALFHVEGPSTIFARFEGRRVRQGDEVVVYGFPLMGALSSTGNTTTGNVAALSGVQDDTRLLQISAPVQPGNSGGPLMNRSGSVVGIVLGSLDDAEVYKVVGDIPQNVNFAIKGSIVQNFLESFGVFSESVMENREVSVADVADLGRSFSVRVLCYK